MGAAKSESIVRGFMDGVNMLVRLTIAGLLIVSTAVVGGVIAIIIPVTWNKSSFTSDVDTSMALGFKSFCYMFCYFTIEQKMRLSGYIGKVMEPSDLRELREIMAFQKTKMRSIDMLGKGLRSTRFLILGVWLCNSIQILAHACWNLNLGVFGLIIGSTLIVVGGASGLISSGRMFDKGWTRPSSSTVVPSVASPNGSSSSNAVGALYLFTKNTESDRLVIFVIVGFVGYMLCAFTIRTSLGIIFVLILRGNADGKKRLKNKLQIVEQKADELQKQLDSQLELVSDLIEYKRRHPSPRQSLRVSRDSSRSSVIAGADIVQYPINASMAATLKEIEEKTQKDQCFHPTCTKNLKSMIVSRACGCRLSCRGHTLKYKEETLSHYCWQHRHYPATTIGPTWTQLQSLQSKVDDFQTQVNHLEKGQGINHELDKLQTFYHGTSLVAALSIQENGFDPDLSGNNAGTMLGKGVYVTTTLVKALNYASPKDCQGAVLQLKVDLGKVYTVSKNDKYMKTWHTKKGYDSAYSAAGLNGKREEHCIWDPKRVHVTSVLLGHTAMANKAGFFVKNGKLTSDRYSAGSNFSSEGCSIM